MSAPFRKTVFDFVVGQNGPQSRAPIDPGHGAVGQAVMHQDSTPAPLIHGRPVLGADRRRLLGTGGLQVVVAVLTQIVLQFRDRSGLLGLVIEPGIKHAQKHPLGPTVVVRIAGVDLAVPVKTEAQPTQLFPVPGAVLDGGGAGVLPGLDRVLFRRQAKGVKSHGMEDRMALHSAEPGHHIRCDIAQGMPYVEPGPRRVREHIQYIGFGLAIKGFFGAVGAVLMPIGLPSGFHFLKSRGGVQG